MESRLKTNARIESSIKTNYIKAQEDELNRVASLIKNEEFSKITEISPRDNMFCNTCEFRIFCEKQNYY